MKKFFITGLYCTEEFNDTTLPPIESYGNDRLEALVNIRRVTVWTEEEWNEAETRRVREEIAELKGKLKERHELKERCQLTLEIAKKLGDENWQTIESAPKDGSSVILGDEHGTTVGYWHKEEFYSDIDDCPWNPTHWMPLPEPPKGK